MPSDRRTEVKQINLDMKQYRENKETKMFIKRRAKLIRNQWRNGITGIENASDVTPGSDTGKVIAHTDKKTLDSYFYRSENRKESKCCAIFDNSVSYLFGPLELRVMNGASD